MSDLKACPFCGRIPDIEDCGEHRWFIRCKCGIAQDKLFFQKCDAVRTWNKRKELRVKDTNVPTTDTISRQEAIEGKMNLLVRCDDDKLRFKDVVLVEYLQNMPSAESESDKRLGKIAELVEGTIEHFDRDDAMDLLYQIKEVINER